MSREFDAYFQRNKKSLETTECSILIPQFNI